MKTLAHFSAARAARGPGVVNAPSMCCFSGAEHPVVSNTQIFASTSGERATLVYSMRLSVASEVAMILPLPVRPASGERALSFVNLEGYPDFFDDLRRGFPVPVSRGLRPAGPFAVAAGEILEVHAVGAFEASFVPSVRDFGRLDARFRLSDDVWQKLPLYGDYGFAVFRLAPGTDKAIHPMALRFQTRHPERTFFPTVHVHDGEVHSRARFDHSLYYQILSDRKALPGEHASYADASHFMNEAKSKALVSMSRHVYMKKLSGDLPNRDFFVLGAAESVSELYEH
jgi:hypothetical protein